MLNYSEPVLPWGVHCHCARATLWPQLPACFLFAFKKSPQSECGWKGDAYEVWCVLILFRRSPKFMTCLYSVVPVLCCSADSAAWSHLLNKVLFFFVLSLLMVTGIPLRFRSFNVKQFPDRKPYSSVHVGKLPRLSCKISLGNSGIYEAWGSCANEQMRKRTTGKQINDKWAR